MSEIDKETVETVNETVRETERSKIKNPDRKAANGCLIAVAIIAGMIIMCLICGKISNDNEVSQKTYPVNTNSIGYPTPVPTPTPNAEKQLESIPEKKSTFGRYEYSYKSNAEMTIALFYKNFIPRDDKIFVGATKDVIKKAFKDEATGTPSLTTHGGQSKIRIDSSKYVYFVLPVKQDTGEVHSLIISRELRSQ